MAIVTKPILLDATGKEMVTKLSEIADAIKTQKEVKIVSWTDGSWADISAMMQAHYRGEINVADYWSIGDEKTVHLNAIRACEEKPDEGYANAVTACELKFKIIDFNHDEIAGAGGRAAVSFIMSAKTGGGMYVDWAYNDSYTAGQDDVFSTSWIKEYMNKFFFAALPVGLQNLIKPVRKEQVRGRWKDAASTPTPPLKDSCDCRIWIPSHTEFWGGTPSDHGYSSYVFPEGGDGEQYEYFKLASNRLAHCWYGDTWLRTSYADGSGACAFCVYDDDDDAYCNDGSTDSNGALVPGFSI